jgi:hypothetical protein
VEPVTVLLTTTTQAPPPPAPPRVALIAGLAALGAGAASAALGTGFAVASGDAERALATATRDAQGRITSPTQREAFGLDARARADSGAAAAFFIAAAVCGAAGAGLLVFDRVTATPSPGGVSLSVPLDATFRPVAVGAR